MINRAEEMLVRGSKILEPLFSKHGFDYMALATSVPLSLNETKPIHPHRSVFQPTPIGFNGSNDGF